MKTKKLLYTGCFMAASMLLLTSCGDFLDEDPKGQLNPETFYTIEDDYTAGVNTLYDKVNQTQSWTNPMYPQWQGDDITANPGPTSRLVLRSMHLILMVPTRVLQKPGLSIMQLSKLPI